VISDPNLISEFIFLCLEFNLKTCCPTNCGELRSVVVLYASWNLFLKKNEKHNFEKLQFQFQLNPVSANLFPSSHQSFLSTPQRQEEATRRHFHFTGGKGDGGDRCVYISGELF